MKKLIGKATIFVALVVLTEFIFELLGIEHFLLGHFATWGAIGVILIWAIKLHVFCCAIPAVFMYIQDCRCHEGCDHKH